MSLTTAALAAAYIAAGVWSIAHAIRGARRNRAREAAWWPQCTPPRIDTQPGASQHLLDQCNAIANQTRKEK
jgi:hypothetical protein